MKFVSGKIYMIWNYLKTAIICLVIMVCLLGSASAIEFNLIIDPEFEFFHPAFAQFFYETETDIVIQLQMANNDGVEWCAYSMPLRIYGTGNISSVTWVEARGTTEPSIVRTNGFEMGGGIWGIMNAINTWSWDGNLPDTMNHTVISCMGSTSDGWIPEMNQLTTYLEFHLNVSLNHGDTGSVCIDSVSLSSDPKYDWLFSISQDFGGPYCFRFATSACGDANLDGGINILDVVYIINYKYKGGPQPLLLDLCDVNNDDGINILDVVHLINYKYKGGNELNCPSPAQ